MTARAWSEAATTLALHEIPPNGQGLAALLMLGMLEHHAIADHPVDAVDSLHVQIEAMKLAVADAHRYVADPDSLDVPTSALLDPAYLTERAALTTGVPRGGRATACRTAATRCTWRRPTRPG